MSLVHVSRVVSLRSGLALCLVLCACGDDDAPPPPPVDAGPDLAVVRCAADLDCSDGLFCNGRERCAPASVTADSHGCVAGPPACGMDACDEAAATCPLGCPDADADGATSADCGGDDCDDANAARYPGNTEVCDAVGLDEDCNPATLGADADGDGVVSILCCNSTPGGLVCGTDCDDAQSGVNPGSPESCNGIDDDCDSLVDENADGSSMRLDCYADADGDGYSADVWSVVSACACGSGRTPTAPISVATIDCDDADAARHPGATEVCNYLDDNCSGAADEGVTRPTATISTRPEALTMRMSGSATLNNPFPLPREAHLTSLTLANDRGAAWYETVLHLGYGALRVVVHARAAASAGSGVPSGGWAVVLATTDAVGTDLGPAGDALGVPTDRSGLAFEWRFAGDGADTVTVARIRPGYHAVLVGPVAVDPGMQLSTNGLVDQRIVIEYTPDDPATVLIEERLVVRNAEGGAALIDVNRDTSLLSNEFAVNLPLEFGFTGANDATGPVSVFVTADASSMETYFERAGVCF